MVICSKVKNATNSKDESNMYCTVFCMGRPVSLWVLRAAVSGNNASLLGAAL